MAKAWCIALVVLTLVVLGRVVTLDFVNVDDPVYVYNNPHVNAGLTWDNVVWAWTTNDVDVGFWIPPVLMSLQLDATVFGVARPWGFHLVNLLWHTVNVCLVYVLLFRLTGSIGRSAVAAALFAVHPLRVESVAWVTERKDVLCTFFGLCSLLAYVSYARHPSWPRYLLVALGLLLGMMCKPMLVTWPCVMLLLDWWPLRRLERTSLSRLLLEKVPLFAVIVPFVVLTLSRHGDNTSSGGELSWEARFANAICALAWYVHATLLPLRLAYPYPWIAVPLLSPGVLIGAALLVGIGVLLALFGRRHPEQVVGWLWFAGMLVPVLGLIAGDASRADRFTYLPHVGLFLALVWFAADILDRWQIGPRLRFALVVALLVPLSFLTWRQIGYWQNAETLWLRALEVNGPENNRANGSLATYYYLRGDKALAAKYASQAMLGAVDRDRYTLLWGSLLVEQGRSAEALPFLQTALKYPSNHADAHHNLGLAYFDLKRFDLAAHHWREVVKSRPRDAKLHHALALALVESGDRAAALPHAREAMRLEPQFADARALLEELEKN